MVRKINMLLIVFRNTRNNSSFVKLSGILLFLLTFSHLTYTNDFSNEINNSHQRKRSIVFPPFTVIQFTVALAVPAQIPNRTVVTNLGVISNVPLPSKIEQFYPFQGQSRQFTHNNLYDLLETSLNWYNLNGNECILKTICQVSNMINKKELISKMLQLLFTPSVIKRPVAKIHYLIAEQTGKSSNVSCSEKYPLCSLSILDFIDENI